MCLHLMRLWREEGKHRQQGIGCHLRGKEVAWEWFSLEEKFGWQGDRGWIFTSGATDQRETA